MENRESLIADLSEIATSGMLRSTFPGPSGIATTLKQLLRMDASTQSRKHGFKIATSKIGQKTRMTMFAKVPSWHLSNTKSSFEILEKFGYGSGLNRRLNCTLEYLKPNGQGLYLDLSVDNRELLSKSSSELLPVCVWIVDELKQKLSEKYEASAHVEYITQELAGKVYFQVTGLRTFGPPSIDNFEKLLRRGAITMDHVIGIDQLGGAHEKGPLFKISRSDFLTLFPNTEFRKL